MDSVNYYYNMYQKDHHNHKNIQTTDPKETSYLYYVIAGLSVALKN